jgi:hypothetical protein
MLDCSPIAKASHGCAASPSQMGRFETRWLTAEKNLSALADLSGRWIDCVHARRPPRGVVLDTVLDERGLRRLAVLQTCKRLCKLAESLHGMGHKIDRTLVGELLHKLDYSL